jgi:hypothetical protein
MTTDPVPDREGKNFCEEWQPGNNDNRKSRTDAHKNKFDALFRS